MSEYVKRILFDYHAVEGIKLISVFFTMGAMTAYYLPPVVELFEEHGHLWPVQFALVLGAFVAFVEVGTYYLRRMENE